MKRISTLHESPPSLAFDPSAAQVEQGVFSPAAEQADIALFTPLHYEPGYAYPLFVWLHAEGEHEGQLKRIMPVLSMRNYAAVAPRGFARQPGVRRFYWPNNTDLEQAGERVDAAIDLAGQRFHINPERIFLAGEGAGGTLALRLALSRPDRFGGVLSLGGPFPTGCGALGNLCQARKLPLFLAVGRESPTYPQDQVCDHLKLLHTAGIPITMRLYPGGDGLTAQMLGDVDRWIMSEFATTCA